MDECSTSGVNLNADQTCMAGLKCNTTDYDDEIAKRHGWGYIVLGWEGLCVKEKFVDCTCAGGGGKAGIGQNGIECPGKPTVYCSDKDDACYSQGGATIDRGEINFNKNDAAYTDTAIRNVACTPVKPEATCTCIGNGTVNENNFSCTAPDGTTGTGTCKSQFQCQPNDGQIIPQDQIENARGNVDGSHVLKNIKCDRPMAECTCDPNVAANGFHCTQFGKTETDTCDTPEQKCITDPNSILLNGESTENQLFGGAPLKGIRCELPNLADKQKIYPTTPPPPPPPCLDNLNPEGCPTFSTAVGKLGTKPEEFIKSLFAVLLSVSGGIAILLIMRAGYQMMTSQGEPQKLNNARDHLVAAIVGLIFLIFSFVILQIIGFDILRLPGFGG